MSQADTSELDEPFGGLVINGYGIYNENDQKALQSYMDTEIAKASKAARIDEIERLLSWAEENELALEARQTYAPESASIDIELTVLAIRLAQLKGEEK